MEALGVRLARRVWVFGWGGRWVAGGSVVELSDWYFYVFVLLRWEVEAGEFDLSGQWVAGGYAERMNSSEPTDLDCPVCSAVGRHQCTGGTYLKFSDGELVPVTLLADVITPWAHMVPLGKSKDEAKALFRARLLKSYPGR